MRKWHKYIVTDDLQAPLDQSISSTFQEHADDLGGFESNEHYVSKETFFQTYYHESRRALNYDRFIVQHVSKDQEILSLACGRSPNELLLMERGFNVTCSDLERPDSYPLAKNMFPQMEQWDLDILAGPAEKSFDVVLCLSLIYLFDDDQLSHFFTNVHSSLKDGGYLILDSAGPPDNHLAHWINESYLRYEAVTVRLFRNRKYARQHIIVRKHQGYRRTDRDIIEAAKKCDLAIMEKQHYDFTHEFERSRIFSRLMGALPFIRPIAARLGRIVPYTRMFKLQKV
jgi:SAM-dependent methyltransferase